MTQTTDEDDSLPRLHETFAATLRSAREACGWSQAELAHRTGLSIEAYGRLERGRVLPRVSTLVRLAKVLGVPLDGLLGIGPARSSGDDLRAQALLTRIAAAGVEELRILAAILGELQRWKRDGGSAR
ncbi:MAG: helix-turn-helix domain-containing protein [Myxococcales bacterium]